MRHMNTHRCAHKLCIGCPGGMLLSQMVWGKFGAFIVTPSWNFYPLLLLLLPVSSLHFTPAVTLSSLSRFLSPIHSWLFTTLTGTVTTSPNHHPSQLHYSFRMCLTSFDQPYVTPTALPVSCLLHFKVRHLSLFCPSLFFPVPLWAHYCHSSMNLWGYWGREPLADMPLQLILSNGTRASFLFPHEPSPSFALYIADSTRRTQQMNQNVQRRASGCHCNLCASAHSSCVDKGSHLARVMPRVSLGWDL